MVYEERYDKRPVIVAGMSDSYVDPPSPATYGELIDLWQYQARDAEIDLQAETEALCATLRQQHESLAIEGNRLQMEHASDLRDFLIERESLSSELMQLKISESLKVDRARIAHHSRMTQLREDHAKALAALVPATVVRPRTGTKRSLDGTREALKESQQSLDETKGSAGPPVSSERSEQLENELKEIAERKATRVREAAVNRRTRMDELVALIMEVDMQNAVAQDEINAFEKESARKTQEYNREIAKLNAEIDKVYQDRSKVEEERKQKIDALQQEIESMEAKFTKKIGDESRVAEKLRVKLENIKREKAQRIAAEKQMAAERCQILKDNSEIRKRMIVVESEIERMKGVVSALRKDVTLTYGPLMTTSLFL
jgi:DNA repair exonuclease SbcCD ATPase subunit